MGSNDALTCCVSAELPAGMRMYAVQPSAHGQQSIHLLEERGDKSACMLLKQRRICKQRTPACNTSKRMS